MLHALLFACYDAADNSAVEYIHLSVSDVSVTACLNERLFQFVHTLFYAHKRLIA